ncbi:argininosuccinate synthase [Pontibacter sp. G13]|uniref:argininosuccinate synthase n=1 Tax=Pontibacter sp. G13 TaxID=3074898 RepID=UPI0028893223|nr:argininosuccinate synthase [Pontibacter sp. G13]WNJ16354.1 argininosuccinate synthase [Pontibacter sp. G13]
MNPKVVLAFSGGLDTSFCVKHLTIERGMEVHAAIVNTGGFSAEELEHIGQRAKELGAASFKVLDEVQHYYEQCVKYLIFGNILKNNSYPLSVSAERVFQAVAIANYAVEIGASAIAHGSTGAGNDQVRFDLVFDILAPDTEIITPIRDLQLSREAEIEYLQAQGVEYSWEKAQYSINKGLWGTSVGGKETLNSWDYLPESAYPTQVTKSGSEIVELKFEQGELVGINDQTFESPVQAIQALEELAGPYGVGRDIHVGDTIIGIKGRVGFEAAAPLIIIKAHHLLEKHVLTKWQLYWKEQLANWYGMLLHEGQYLEPVMRDIEGFLGSTQANVTGTVQVQLTPYQFQALGIQSEFDLMSAKFGTYGEMNRAWSGEDVKGFTKILANSSKIFHQVHSEKSEA